MLRLMITRLTFNEAPTIAFGGASFGNVGSFEKIQGRAFGELDPANPLNAVWSQKDCFCRKMRKRLSSLRRSATSACPVEKMPCATFAI